MLQPTYVDSFAGEWYEYTNYTKGARWATVMTWWSIGRGRGKRQRDEIRSLVLCELELIGIGRNEVEWCKCRTLRVKAGTFTVEMAGISMHDFLYWISPCCSVSLYFEKKLYIFNERARKTRYDISHLPMSWSGLADRPDDRMIRPCYRIFLFFPKRMEALIFSEAHIRIYIYTKAIFGTMDTFFWGLLAKIGSCFVTSSLSVGGTQKFSFILAC